MNISAYVIAYNNQQYLSEVLLSILEQDIKILEIIIIDDGSNPPISSDFLEYHPKIISLHRNEQNMGRGYSRHKAMKLCKGDFVLCVDSTNTIEKNFVSKLMKYFDDESVASTYGQLYVSDKKNFLNRWKARHLFKEGQDTGGAVSTDILITYGTIIKRDHYNLCGGFNKNLRYNEDKEMGLKFVQNGYHMIGDSEAKIFSIKNDTFFSIMERYSRWYMDSNETPNFSAYLHNIKASLNPMMKMDLKELDLPSAIFSLMTPHFQLFHSTLTYLKFKFSKSKRLKDRVL